MEDNGQFGQSTFKCQTHFSQCTLWTLAEGIVNKANIESGNGFNIKIKSLKFRLNLLSSVIRYRPKKGGGD